MTLGRSNHRRLSHYHQSLLSLVIMINGHSDSTPHVHVVLVPLMAQGHMIPMVDLARRLAERGVLATIITTPSNASRFKTIIDRARDSHLPLRFVPLRFPCAEAGLPDGLENLDLITAPEHISKFFDAANLLAPQLESYLRSPHRPFPTCIISDACSPWTLHVARALGVPRLSFFSICCFTLLCIHNIAHHGVYNTITDETEPFTVPGVEPKIEVTQVQAPGFFPGENWAKLREEIREAEEASVGVVVNSFHELEPWYVDQYQKATGKKVWVLGPMSLCNRDKADMVARGNQASINSSQCLSWLDSMKPGSVLYVSFGSLVRSPPSQIYEIGLGLEASSCPFIWVVKNMESSSAPEVEVWLSEFEQRTKDRGLVIKGWAPQVMILTHPSVGGFMTHCGWNSSLESISAGVPMITWPSFGDQFLNERMIVEVLRTGVGVGVKFPNYWGFGLDGGQPMIKRDEIEKTVRNLMGEGEEAEERKERAKKLGMKARMAMEEEGSSHVNMTVFIEYISQIGSNKHVEEQNGV